MATQRFAEIADRDRLGLDAEAITATGDPEKEGALDAASAIASGLIGNVYKLPLVSWEDDLRHYVVCIADFNLLAKRGYSPRGSDDVVQNRHDTAMDALKAVAAGRARLLNCVDSTPTTYEGGAYIVSRPRRGW